MTAQHRAALTGAAICDMRHRGLIELAGRDRATWLNNLVTNTIKDLRPGEGNYTFATNAKGRILFDGNMLVLHDAILIDVDRQLVSGALAHFDRYHITEEVTFTDRSDEFARIGLLGPGAVEIAEALGAKQAAAMASLASTTVELCGKHRLLVRHDFAGTFGLELYVETEDAQVCRNRLLEAARPLQLVPIAAAVVDILRIEAGIPVYGRDIDENTLPAETGRTDCAVSYVKGCYLGQEIVERMRSRGSVARRLVGLRFGTPAGVTAGSVLSMGGAKVGGVTSWCHSVSLDAPIGLGYVKGELAEAGTAFEVEGSRGNTATVVAVPFGPAPSP